MPESIREKRREPRAEKSVMIRPTTAEITPVRAYIPATNARQKRAMVNRSDRRIF